MNEIEGDDDDNIRINPNNSTFINNSTLQVLANNNRDNQQNNPNNVLVNTSF